MFDVDRLLVAASAWWLPVVMVQNLTYGKIAKQAGVVDDNPDLYTGYLANRPFMLILATGEVVCGAWLAWQFQPSSGWWFATIIVAAGFFGIMNCFCLFINWSAVWVVAAWLGLFRPPGLRGYLQDMLAGIVAAAAAAWLLDWMAAGCVWTCAMVSYYIMVKSFDARLNLELAHDGVGLSRRCGAVEETR